ncbi:MAG: CHASE2 domain-containing protein [Burkholderiales bacterium]|nr:CHASE2 domain-containing protein [Burkholderiales bacterium]
MKARVPVERIALREWMLLSLLILALVAGLAGTQTLGRADQVWYDRCLQINSQPARDDIIIVAIDDYSLRELGKWPWPRPRHAELLRQIDAAQPLAIGMDLLFSEADPAGGDSQLAEALTLSNKVILPLVSESAGQGLSASRPLPMLAGAARQLGHIHLELDKDGVARSLFLREGSNGEWWPHFALAMQEVANKVAPGTEASLPGARLPVQQRKEQRTSDAGGVWQRDYRMHIPYYGSSGHFQSVPYVAVLRGEVPAAFFRNKYVLIGATATGMADSFPTPVSADDGMISGIEINANILASLLDGRSITLAPALPAVLCNLLLIALALLAYQLLSPRTALLINGSLIVATLIASFLMLRYAGYWLPPSAALLGLSIAYPLWSWRRLEAAILYLGEEFSLLDKEPHLLPEPAATEPAERTPALSDTLEQRINAMRSAASRVRDLRQFVSDSLSSLPDATLVTTTDGNVLLSNQAARDYFAGLGFSAVNDALAPYLFAGMSHPQSVTQGRDRGFSWWNLLDLQHSKSMAQGVEVRDGRQNDMLIKSAPCYNADRQLAGWIISLIDISAIRAAERSRDETLHFISHDMRSPQASILALLELQQDPATALPQAEFLARIEKASRITLALADNFVQLARAESQDYRYETVDFQDILLDAGEEMWSLAKSKNIRIGTDIAVGEYPVSADRALMTRVLTNLLSNAIKYSPRDTTITCSLQLRQSLADAQVICTISDQGYGIARADQNKLFQRFQRLRNSGQPHNDGVGLGMVFVKAVLDRHHAQITFSSVPDRGTTFHIKLPAVLI